MAALFILLTLYSSVRAGYGRGFSRWWMVAVATAWCAGLCKESAVILPALVVLYDWTLMRRPWRGELRTRAPLYLAISSCWIPIAALMAVAPRLETIGNLRIITPLLYAKNQCPAMLMRTIRLRSCIDKLDLTNAPFFTIDGQSPLSHRELSRDDAFPGYCQPVKRVHSATGRKHFVSHASCVSYFRNTLSCLTTLPLHRPNAAISIPPPPRRRARSIWPGGNKWAA